MDIIYLDNASTTKPSKEVIEEALYHMEHSFANPSSLHNMGLDIEKKIKLTKYIFAKYLNVSPDEIYFTSGGTESNNLAIQGAFNTRLRTHDHIITVKTEHPSVLSNIKLLEQKGYKVNYLDVDEKGYICENNLLNLMNNRTAIVSIMDTNNETGVIQNINKIGKLIKEQNSSTIFHVDGVQAFGKKSLNLKYVDLFSFSSHKIHGLKGVGGLYVKRGVRITPIIVGGNQQNGIRPGTENTMGIITFGKAAQECYENMHKYNNHVISLRNRLLEIKNKIEDVHINSDEVNGSPYILNLSFLGVKGEVLLHTLEQSGIYVSTGTACSNKNQHNVLRHMINDKDIHTSSIRFSFSHNNTIDEIDKCIEVLQKSVEKLRRFKKR